MGMAYLLAGMAIFFGVHSTAIVAPAWRDQMAAKLGPVGWKALYGVVSIVGFVLMIKGYNLTRAEPVPLYVPPTALRHIAAIVMLPVFPLLLATYLPGAIKRGVKHPMLTATKAGTLPTTPQWTLGPGTPGQRTGAMQGLLTPRRTEIPSTVLRTSTTR